MVKSTAFKRLLSSASYGCAEFVATVPSSFFSRFSKATETADHLGYQGASLLAERVECSGHGLTQRGFLKEDLIVDEAQVEVSGRASPRSNSDRPITLYKSHWRWGSRGHPRHTLLTTIDFAERDCLRQPVLPGLKHWHCASIGVGHDEVTGRGVMPRPGLKLVGLKV